MRWFRLDFGATAPAAAATLVGFLAGHALGAALAARRAPRWSRPLAVYGALELAAAAGFVLVPLGLAAGGGLVAAGYDALRASPALLALARFAVAVTVTLPAAACLGATLPAMGAALVRDTRGLGHAGASLYALNTLGAAAGTALAAFFLPDWIGVRGGYAVAIALQAAVGAGALALAQRMPESAPAPSALPARAATAPGRSVPARGAPARDAEPAATREAAGWGSARGLLVLAALSGFGAFAAQVLLVQAFAQVLNGSVYAFGAVLVVVLLALAAGAALVAASERRGLVDPRTLLGVALAATALGLAAFPALFFRATNGLSYVGSDRAWPGYLTEAIATVAGTAGLPLLAASLVFPLCFALTARQAEASGDTGAGRALGRLAAANTLGSIAGALAAPFVLLPTGGTWSSFVVLGGLYALPAIALPERSPSRRLARDVALGLGWVAIVASLHPTAVPLARLEPGETLVAADASAAGVVAVVEREGQRVIRTDNHSVLGGSAEIVHQERQGHLPLLLHPRAKRVAYVGSATGISAGATGAHPIESLHLVEIVPGVAGAARGFFGAWNRGVYDRPGTEVVLDDARNFLRATRSRFDVIVADLFVPWRAGTGSLYTREHFTNVRERLAPDGVFCQWLPLYQLTEDELATIAATFLDVFPRSALFRGDFYGGFPIAALVGYAGAVASPDEVSAAAAALRTRGERDRWVTDPMGPWALYVGPLGALADRLAPVTRNSDDRPRIEFLAARTHAGGTRGKESPLAGPRWPAWTETLRREAASRGDDVFPSLGADARRTGEGGALLQAAGAAWVAGDFEASARLFAAASEQLPRSLVADAAADPTAAEVWR
jgi:spermidine synthase